MKEKECKNMYKVCVADYLLFILNKLNKIDDKLNKIYKDNNLYT